MVVVPGVHLGDLRQDVHLPALRPVEHLLYQRGNHVDGKVHLWMRGQDFRHMQIVLGCMQAHPGQGNIASPQVFVVRLVHVPDDGDVEWLHQEMACL